MPHHPVMTDVYDYGGNRFQRAGREDFETLPRRVMEALEGIPGFQGDQELVDYMTRALYLYERGDYRQAHRCLTASVERLPGFRPYLLYYILVCERVLATPVTVEGKRYEAQVRRHLGRPRWLGRFTSAPLLMIRCKWCGRYTPYIDPDRPTFGFDTSANSCQACGRMYPMPSWVWDSPDGRAYSYYRMSFNEDAFYEECERDCHPTPRCRRRLTASRDASSDDSSASWTLLSAPTMGVHETGSTPRDSVKRVASVGALAFWGKLFRVPVFWLRAWILDTLIRYRLSKCHGRWPYRVGPEFRRDPSRLEFRCWVCWTLQIVEPGSRGPSTCIHGDRFLDCHDCRGGLS